MLRVSALFFVVAGPLLFADERRAPAPTGLSSRTRGVFFDELSDAIRSERPSLSALRAAATNATAKTAANVTSTVPDSMQKGENLWAPLISPISIEDEVKRLRLHYDSIITTPGAFNSGGYQAARLDLTVLATLFAVISDYAGDVRWKDEAAAARDLLARTASNCKAGSTQVYNEAKLRKADLQDLVSGTGLNARDAEPENDWSAIAQRSPLMEYAERLIEALEDDSRDAGAVQANADSIKRRAELLSMLGVVLTRNGMDEADDDDYVSLSTAMVDESQAVTQSLQRGDFESARSGVSSIRARCDACHEQYR